MSCASCWVILATEIPLRGSRTTNPRLSMIWKASRTGVGLTDRVLQSVSTTILCPGLKGSVNDPGLQILDDMFRQTLLVDPLVRPDCLHRYLISRVDFA